MADHGVVFYREWMDYFRSITDAKRGKLMLALLTLGFDGEVVDLNDKDIDSAYKIMGNEILHDIEKYKAKCERNRKNAKNRRSAKEEKGDSE